MAVSDAFTYPPLPGLKCATYYKPLCLEDALEAFKSDAYCKPKLEHGDRVLIVKTGDRVVADGLITQERGLTLVMSHADCQAGILYDVKNGALGLVHAGWRGNVLNIYRKMVLQMKEKMGSQPEDLKVFISPSLGPSHAEFVNYRQEFPKELWHYVSKDLKIDLWQVSEDQLLETGVLKENLYIARHCTYSDIRRFHSYRRDRTSLRNYTLVRLEA